ncbi:hypothetical protein [Flammeovirga sp. EKP202]|uniref:hypothetical protein n=1 Tax=Flammeovirga sp. EKP202 TaxID=2770592 RepID=UPI00165F4835|nr:hypothetical protein [Flammeovirga sp. EKP202]MBD0404123.1 hypothetical protein [Flammeovirga sp. EKP202]
MKLFNKKLLSFLLIGLGVSSCKTMNTQDQDIEVQLAAVSYNGNIKQIVDNNCFYCHSGETPSAGMDLTTYDNLVEAVKNRGLLNRINNASNPMPQSGLMTKEDRLKLKEWAEKNFPLEGNTNPNTTVKTSTMYYKAPEITAINIDHEGFDFMQKMQGHWVGDMFLLGQNIPWFAFDFRAINTSQVHGLFEGGTMGNLFNTFFVAEYKGVKTIMLRNGGILADIYRTSYFVLTEAENNEYLFVDAYGGKDIMWVKVSFKENKIKMVSYTSRMGSNKPSKHMEFNGQLAHSDLAQKASEKYNFPTKEVVKHFPNGMPLADWGEQYPIVTSATYMMQAGDMSYEELGTLAQDPIQINDIENIVTVDLSFKRTDLSKDNKISVYLSRTPLTDSQGNFKTEYGYIAKKMMDEILLFPEISKSQNDFQLTYLHEGKCYLTFVVDNNQDMIPGKGDYYSESIPLELKAGTPLKIDVDNILRTIQ